MRLDHDRLKAACERLQEQGGKAALIFDASFDAIRAVRTRMSRARDEIYGARGTDAESLAELPESVTMSAAVKKVVDLSDQSTAGYADLADSAQSVLAHQTAIVDQVAKEAPGPGSVDWLRLVADSLTKTTSLPITRLVGSVQMRDSLDQRIEHVTEGNALLCDSPEHTQARLAGVLAAQVSSIADTIQEISESSVKSCGGLKTSISAAEQQLPGNSTEPQSSALGPDIARWNVKLDAELAAMLRAASDMDQEPALSAALEHARTASADFVAALWTAENRAADAMKVRARELFISLQGSVDELAKQAEHLADISTGFSAIAEEMAAAAAPAPVADLPPDALAGLKELYTSDIEHEVHRAEVERIQP